MIIWLSIETIANVEMFYEGEKNGGGQLGFLHNIFRFGKYPSLPLLSLKSIGKLQTNYSFHENGYKFDM